jgi:hypothetical protein
VVSVSCLHSSVLDERTRCAPNFALWRLPCRRELDSPSTLLTPLTQETSADTSKLPFFSTDSRVRTARCGYIPACISTHSYTFFTSPTQSILHI